MTCLGNLQLFSVYICYKLSWHVQFCFCMDICFVFSWLNTEEWNNWILSFKIVIPLYTQQENKIAPVLPCPFQHMVCSMFWILVFLKNVQYYRVGVKFLPLVIHDVDTYPCAAMLFFSLKFLFKCFRHFKIGLFCYHWILSFVVICMQDF